MRETSPYHALCCIRCDVLCCDVNSGCSAVVEWSQHCGVLEVSERSVIVCSLAQHSRVHRGSLGTSLGGISAAVSPSADD